MLNDASKLTFGERLKARRLQIGLKQSAVADAINMTRANLSLLESGHNKSIDFQKGVQIALFLGMDIVEFATGKKGKRNSHNIATYTPVIGRLSSGPQMAWFDLGCPLLGFSEQVVEMAVNNSQSAYALIVDISVGELKKTDVIILDPEADKTPGDDLLIKLKTEDSPMLVQFLFDKPAEISIKSYNDDTVKSYLFNDLEYCHPVIAKVSTSKLKPSPVKLDKENNR